jgi:hypothetical protein
VIVLPPHACVDGEWASNAFGPLDEKNVATCEGRRTWLPKGPRDASHPHVDAKGCGARFVLDWWGNRVKEES